MLADNADNAVSLSPNSKERHAGDKDPSRNGFRKAPLAERLPKTDQYLHTFSDGNRRLEVEGVNGRPSVSPMLRRRITTDSYDSSGVETPGISPLDKLTSIRTPSSEDLPVSKGGRSNGRESKASVIDVGDAELRDLLRRDSKRVRSSPSATRTSPPCSIMFDTPLRITHS
jgi:hypothetical protein